MNLAPSARRIATPTELAFSCMYGLPPSLASILAAMFAGETVRPMKMQIHRLRAALDAEAVDRSEQGYYLTEVGVAECRKALVDFRQWVAAAEEVA